MLEQHELDLLESRLFKKADAEGLWPFGIRLYLENAAVDAYNNSVLQQAPNRDISVANDVLTDLENQRQHLGKSYTKCQ